MARDSHRLLTGALLLAVCRNTGEALHALCSLASVKILTRCCASADAPLPRAAQLDFDSDGALRSTTPTDDSRLPSSGTVVSLTRLFGGVPVRLRVLRQREKAQAREVEALFVHFKLACKQCFSLFFFHVF